MNSRLGRLAPRTPSRRLTAARFPTKRSYSPPASSAQPDLCARLIRVIDAIPGLAIGLQAVLNVLLDGHPWAGSTNPARSLGPPLVAGGAALSSYRVYVIGPVPAACLYKLMRGSKEHAQGTPNDLFLALEKV